MNNGLLLFVFMLGYGIFLDFLVCLLTFKWVVAPWMGELGFAALIVDKSISLVRTFFVF